MPLPGRPVRGARAAQGCVEEAVDDRVVSVAVLVQVGVDGQRARGVYAHARPTASLPGPSRSP